MNTSANKGRIVDEGWMNVLKNIFGCDCGIFRNRSSDTRVYVFSSDSREPNPNNKNIFVMSESIQEKQEQNQENYVLPNVPATENTNRHGQNQPSTSEQSYELENISMWATKSCKVKGRAFVENQPVPGPSNPISKQKYLRQLMGEKLLRCMIMNIDNECVYISLFKGLLRLEEYLKTQTDNSHLLHLYNNSDEVHDSDEQTLKNEQTRAKYVKKCTDKILNDALLQHIGISISDHMDTMPAMIGQISERISKRRELLSHSTLYSNTEESYGEFLELLIDLEESFT